MQGKKNGVPQGSKVGILLLDIDLTECVGLGIEFDNWWNWQTVNFKNEL